MASQRLGQFYEGFASWRRAIAKTSPESQPVVFSNFVADVAGWIRQGLDRAVAADELTDIAQAIGFAGDADEIQHSIGEQFDKIERLYNGGGLEPLAEQIYDPDDTSEVLEAFERSDRKQTNKRNGHAEAAIEINFRYPQFADQMPRRPWIVPGLLLRRHLTLLIAPPGSGKSLLTMQLGLMCAAPMPWAGWRPRQQSRVLMINSEEDSDELERRFWATSKVMQIDRMAVRSFICYAENPSDIVIAKADNRTKTVVATPMMEELVRSIKQKQIDILIVDPFAETFIGDENSNSELKWAATLWRLVARATNCAVLLVHHTKKYSSSENAGDMDAARGGGALAGVARIVCTLFGMSATEATDMLDDVDERVKYLRFDDAKSNLSLLSPAARWFCKQTVQLPNDDDDQVADEVGVLVPWKPPTAFDAMDIAKANRVLDLIELGVLNNAGEPSGNWFMHWAGGQKPKFWVGDVIVEGLGCSVKEAKDIIAKWLKNQVIETFTATTPQLRGHASDNNVRVVPSNRPGRSSHDEL